MSCLIYSALILFAHKQADPDKKQNQFLQHLWGELTWNGLRWLRNVNEKIYGVFCYPRKSEFAGTNYSTLEFMMCLLLALLANTVRGMRKTLGTTFLMLKSSPSSH